MRGQARLVAATSRSPLSTIAAEIAGLTAAAAIARVNHDPGHARLYQATADDFARNIKTWTLTTTGTSPFGSRYFIRVSKTGDPNAAITYGLGNGSITADQRSVIDAGFLELVRLGVLPASDPDIQASVKIVDDTIERTTNNGSGYYRYGTTPTESVDGYGDCFQPSGSSCTLVGKPWPTPDPVTHASNTGTGHLWPVLSSERGEYDTASHDPSGASTLLTAMRNMTSGQGLEPEQAWENPDLAASPFGTDPTLASIGFVSGQPAGSASPLTWAQASYARLALDISAGRDLETPDIVTERYVARGMPGTLPLTVTSPTAGATVTTPTVTVSGTTMPGGHVDAESVGPLGGTAGIASAKADSHGNWTLALPTSFASTTITVTATLHRSTAYVQRYVIGGPLPGTTVLSVSDPTGDDNGPGTYQYPTASDFVAGSFDVTHFAVSQDGTNVYIETALRTLVSTFGSLFGAQLLDIYVHARGAATMSTASAYPGNMNCKIASPWSERLEAQGFASPVWVDTAGDSVGTAQLVPDGPSATATLILPESKFGTVGSGWTFTVALTGQDGTHFPPTRDFTGTPGQYTFGVCASGGSSPICASSVDPNTVPKVMDTITPPGTSQATELDPTLARSYCGG